jgi:hypothetical protein
MLLQIDTVNGMSKTHKNHPQTMAHHTPFNNTTYDIRLRNNTKISIYDIHEDNYTLTPSLRVSGRGINLALAPQTTNFYPISVRSSKSLRHLTHSIWVQCPRLVSSETPLQNPTPDETEAFHRGRSRSYTVQVTRHEKASQSPTPAISRRPLGVLSFFIATATWINCTRNYIPNFGQTRTIAAKILWSSLFDTSNVNQVLMSIYMTISNYSCQKYGTFIF